MYKAASLSVPPTEGWQPSCTCPAQGLGALGLGTARGGTGDTSPPCMIQLACPRALAFSSLSCF